MDTYDSTPSRNTGRAVGGGSSGSMAEIPGKVNEPMGKDTVPTKAGNSPTPGQDVKAFTSGGLISPFVKGETLGGKSASDSDSMSREND